MYPPREDLPLPTQPPYTAFIGNLAFDLTEQDLESFFGSLQVKNVKVIKDRDDRPKGFGYVEFEGLDDLKGALAQSGTVRTYIPLIHPSLSLSVPCSLDPTHSSQPPILPQSLSGRTIRVSVAEPRKSLLSSPCRHTTSTSNIH